MLESTLSDEEAGRILRYEFLRKYLIKWEQ